MKWKGKQQTEKIFVPMMIIQLHDIWTRRSNLHENKTKNKISIDQYDLEHEEKMYTEQNTNIKHLSWETFFWVVIKESYCKIIFNTIVTCNSFIFLNIY